MMKAMGKRLSCLLLAAMLVIGMAVASGAASGDYSVHVTGGKIQFIQYGTVVGTFSPKKTDLTLTTDSDGDFLVCYHDAKGVYRGVTLGGQTSLSISGTMNSLTLSKNLDKAISITLTGNASVGTVTVNNESKMTINGKVTTLTLNDAASVTVGNNAAISKAQKSDSKATIKTITGKTISASTVRNPASSSPSRRDEDDSDDIRLRVRPINSDGDSTLDDLLEDLNDNVEATDRRTGDYIDGRCKWNSRRSSVIDSDGSYSFTFYPDESGYDPVTGTIKIYTDDISEDITLVYDEREITVYADDDMTLGDIDIEDYVTAENDDGDEVRGRFKWDKKSSTKLEDSSDSRSYDFTFTPSSSRYEKQEGSLRIEVLE